MKRFTCVAVLSVGVLSGVGCSGKDPARVSRSELAEFNENKATLSPGDEQNAVLRKFRDGNSVKLSEATISGVRVEEWKAEAVRSSTQQVSVVFLYFAKGSLVESRDTRWNYREDTGLAERLKK